MYTMSLSGALLGIIAGTAAAGGGAWLFTARHYRGLLTMSGAQFEQSERARLKAQELALQARQQVEALQQQLSEAKRDGVIQNAASSARAAAAAAEQAKAAQAKARADLIAQLEANDANDAGERSASASGFPDTQPFH